MKNILLFILLFPVLYSNTYGQTGPGIKFINRDSVYDYGTIRAGDKPRYQFEIKNTGDSVLIITDMQSETGDFKFEWPPKPLKPHKKTLIYVTYSPKDPTVLGSFRSAIYITSNATEKPYTFIHVSGTVLPSDSGPVSTKVQQSSRGGRGGR